MHSNRVVCVCLQTLVKEGIKGMYKGISAPLATVAVFNAVLFASRGQMETLLKHADGEQQVVLRTPKPAGSQPHSSRPHKGRCPTSPCNHAVCCGCVLYCAGSRLTLSDQLVAAVGASCAVSLVATPTELLKCRLQAQGCSATARQRLIDAGLDPSKHAIYKGPTGAAPHSRPAWDNTHLAAVCWRQIWPCCPALPWRLGPPEQANCSPHAALNTGSSRAAVAVMHADVARQVLRHEGGPLGLFKGLTATLWRESLGNMAMFGVYELIKQQMVATKGLASTQQLSHSDLLLAGGLGGTAFWLGCYPLGECTRAVVLAVVDVHWGSCVCQHHKQCSQCRYIVMP